MTFRKPTKWHKINGCFQTRTWHSETSVLFLAQQLPGEGWSLQIKPSEDTQWKAQGSSSRRYSWSLARSHCTCSSSHKVQLFILSTLKICKPSGSFHTQQENRLTLGSSDLSALPSSCHLNLCGNNAEEIKWGQAHAPGSGWRASRGKTTSVTEAGSCISRNKESQEGRESCHSEGEIFLPLSTLLREKSPPLIKKKKKSKAWQLCQNDQELLVCQGWFWFTGDTVTLVNLAFASRWKRLGLKSEFFIFFLKSKLQSIWHQWQRSCWDLTATDELMCSSSCGSI